LDDNLVKVVTEKDKEWLKVFLLSDLDIQKIN